MPGVRVGLMPAVLAALLAGAGAPGRASAQLRVEIEPAIGVYGGLSSFTKPAGSDPFAFSESLSQWTAVALGGRATGWLGTGFGVRLSVLTAPSEVGPNENNDPLDRQPVPATVTTAALEALVPLKAFASKLRVFLSGGVALVDRGGDAYQGFDGTSDVGGILGIGSQYRLSDRLGLQADFQTLLYSLQLTDPDGLEYPSAFQTDILLTVGLVVKLSSTPEE